MALGFILPRRYLWIGLPLGIFFVTEYVYVLAGYYDANPVRFVAGISFAVFATMLVDKFVYSSCNAKENSPDKVNISEPYRS